MIIIIKQFITIILILISGIDIVLKLMLVFGYFMLFRQERWHKHLNIMILMMLILYFASGGLAVDMILEGKK